MQRLLRALIWVASVGCGSRTAYVQAPPTEADVVIHVPCQGARCGPPPAAPPPPPPQIPPPRMLAAGWHHSCALTEDGGVYCWGSNSRGQLGDVGDERTWVPGRVPGLPRMDAVWAGADQTCARAAEDGRVWCWGDTGLPEDGTEGPRQLAYADVRQMALNFRRGCLVDDGGRTFCWGDIRHPYGPRWRTPQRVPVDAPVEIVWNMQRGCALLQGGELRCWGLPHNYYRTERAESPTFRLPGIENAAMLAMKTENQDEVLIVDRRGRVFVSENGRQRRMQSRHPVLALRRVDGIEDPAQVQAGSNVYCARTAEGTVACWGSNLAGELGDGTRAARTTPTFLPLAGIREIAVGQHHVCARDDERVWCWGSNTDGQVGLERPREVPEPYQLPW
ncbi:MAG: hypothetical protein VYE22_26875 [Myxococcota bacterium]|nr:hypothetical protein [Myxococcota bacterium]